MLFKLKEIEYVDKIGEIAVSGNGGMVETIERDFLCLIRRMLECVNGSWRIFFFTAPNVPNQVRKWFKLFSQFEKV